MKILGLYINNKKICSWNMILISNDFCHKSKMYHFNPYNVLLAISTNVLFMTAFVLQAHICKINQNSLISFNI